MVMADSRSRSPVDMEALSLLEQHARMQHTLALQEAARQQDAKSRVVYDEMDNQTQQAATAANVPVGQNEQVLPAASPMTASDDYHRQLKRLEEENRKHIKYTAEPPAEGPHTHPSLDYQAQLQLLEDQCRMACHRARVETEVLDTQYQQESPLVSPQQSLMSPATEDYQMALLLLEQQNKKRLLMARLEQDEQPSTQTDTEKLTQEAQERARRQQGHAKQWHFRRYRVEGQQAPRPRSSDKGKTPAQQRYGRHNDDLEHLVSRPITRRVSLKRPRLDPSHPTTRRRPSLLAAPRIEQSSALDMDMADADADSASDTVSLASTKSDDSSSREKITTPPLAASQLESQPQRPQDGSAPYTVLHRVKCWSSSCDLRMYEDEPRSSAQLQEQPQRSHLAGGRRISNLGRWFRDRPSLIFVVIRTHDCSRERRETDLRDGPALTICPILDEVRDAFAELARRERSDAARPWLAHITEPDGDDWIAYEYPLEFVFHYRNQITDLEPQVERAGDVINWYEADSPVAELFGQCDSLFDRGLVSLQTIRFLFCPGEHVVSIRDDGGSSMTPACFVLRDWPSVKRQNVSLDCWAWLYNGTKLERRDMQQSVSLPRSDTVAITDLCLFPLRFASEETVQLLRDRGSKFLHLHRTPIFSYDGPAESHQQYIAPRTRFMLDRRRHEGSGVLAGKCRPGYPDLDLSADMTDDDLMLVPNHVWAIGVDDLNAESTRLFVDNTSPITWAADPLDNLIIPPPKRDLILALLSQAASPSGVLILFHGPPGTGKSLSVGAAAEELCRPLHRATARGFLARADDYLRQARRTRGVLHIDTGDAPPFLLESEVLPLLQGRHAAADNHDDAGPATVVVTTHHPTSEAVRSAFAAVIRFPRLDARARARVWLAESGLQAPAGEAWEAGDPDKVKPQWMGDLLRMELNGRQIGNAVAAARKLAAHGDTQFCWQNVYSVIF